MFDTVYIEKEIEDHPRTKAILEKVHPHRIIPIDRYGEIFNRKKQNFRIQKNHPSLILAKKHGQFLHPIPTSYGIGHKNNAYFSHIFNCPFDCSYCYLQGMFRSAHFVLFVNYEDFMQAIENSIKETPCCFFSGYDADSLALDNLTGFLDTFLPFFYRKEKSFLEIRTKATAISPILRHQPFSRCIIAFTISPHKIIEEYEKKTPSLDKRIEAMQTLQANGWQIGLRFDPVIPIENASFIYKESFRYIFSKIDIASVHSVTLGVFRLPKSYYSNMKKINAGSGLLPLLKQNNHQEVQEELISTLLDYFPKTKVFSQ